MRAVAARSQAAVIPPSMKSMKTVWLVRKPTSGGVMKRMASAISLGPPTQPTEAVARKATTARPT
jgi:hypothetical protein